MGNMDDVDKLFACGDDLIQLLKDRKDFNNFARCLESANALGSSCDDDLDEIQRSIRDYQKKLEDCRRKTEETKAELEVESEVDRLQKELEVELERERFLKEELREVENEISELGSQRSSIEETRQKLKKAEQDAVKAEKMLSMYASVTKVIPNINDCSEISGYMVDRDKNFIKKFAFDTTKAGSYDTCNNIWDMINCNSNL